MIEKDKTRILYAKSCCKRLQLLGLLVISQLLFYTGYTQNGATFSLPDGQSKVEIPFENHNNLIILQLKIGRQINSRFILDSGAENTVLIQKVIGDILDLEYTQEYTIGGAGTKDNIKAYRARDVIMKIEGLKARPVDIFVLEEDYLQLPQYLGIRVQGILGLDFFKNLVVRIDYEDRKLVVYDPATFEKPRRYKGVPVIKEKGKPYLKGRLCVEDEKCQKARFLIDTGASHAILVEMNEQNQISVPRQHIEGSLGRGLSGDIPGYIGRVDSINVGGFQLEEVITSFTRRYSKIQRKGRVGTIGGELLSRFDVIIHLKENMIYLKPSEKFDEKFEHNMSGLQLMAFGEDLNRLKVIYVRDGSPADKAGVKEGDEILKINWIWVNWYSLSHIYSIFRSRQNRTIRLKILRGDGKKRVKFDLKRMI
ncbi:MAG: aspartyl protease family protein [Bacteroidales bacterium]|nr:aspartyl protease family protein [Bacteroidales bacterium]MCF8332883.1 aspartyl protease family protein [Bacteroidales bacterium]